MSAKTEVLATEKSVEPSGHTTLGLRLPVFMYHRIAPESGNRSPELTVSPAQFERQLQWLKRRGYETVRLSQMEAFRRGMAPVPSKPVLLTFDDAHAALAEHALPLLKDYGFGAAVFVVTGYFGKTNEWDRAAGWGPFPLMSAEDIRAWASRGIEFGAHSRTHPDLRRLSPAELEDEIGGSRRDLEEIVGAPAVAFAYPFGYQSADAVAAARKHYPWAFIAGGGLNTPKTDSHLLRRVMVRSEEAGVALHSLLRTGWTPSGLWNALRTRWGR